ncbi:MAG: dicarboxylate/amino acid:cation symporter [Verrucomicrobia bacterium CG_4_10_14_3_um_filter_43_23]|nr:MAG: dicarboxylate/amino acid:cation symporter [Verrucomicrobia bacterium CG1_02_43_26]PIP59242.1 MAG: dicarboxylate/amino acid:cation symporter [Verrucomicrobia bacterium CG22_combo_CG10-13_8_21_14_all_43_17]PIX58574.1 MAG: dicarboxylate/amino acid:cation symporter [Verrucomicrobia bacterium CG_4_10_14_3_um_filter_43_23]PIY61026.1 MAG: dicarboxylate/amino acid:cation symporter [Verrucomicrobia bacterium CG_4_10_14_0_8_um_filter_43_34]PJA43867.1 MAG: dicarboxylate/amino acid:cation symporter
MCTQHAKSKPKLWQTAAIYTVAILLGIYSGLSGIEWLQNIGLAVSEIFVNIFKFLSLPLIALSLIVTITNYSNAGAMGKMSRKILSYTFGTTIIAALVACGLYLLLSPSSPNLTGLAEPMEHAHTVSYVKHISKLIPTNLLEPFLHHQVMSVLFMAIAIGVAILKLPDTNSKTTLINFFKGLHGVYLVLTKWVIAVIPFALYGFITASTVQLSQGSDLSGIGTYLTVVVLANLVQGLIILPAWLWWNKISPIRAMKGMLPALSMAFFSKSSTGTLPVTIDAAEKNLNVSPSVSRFVLPLCTTINMNGCAAFIFTTVIYLMQSNGIEVALPTMLLWTLIATVAAIGNAGIPMGCFFLSASLLSGMGVPLALLGLILPFYTIIDMIETSLNVWSDACVTKVVDEKMKTADESIPVLQEA